MKYIPYILNILIIAMVVIVPGPALAFDLKKLDLDKVKGITQSVTKSVKPMSREEEMAFGKDVAAKILGGAPPVTDKELQDYVNQVGLWLAMQTDKPDLPWRFAVLDDNGVNAFTAPGGYVFITRGLLLRCRDEAELAGVLAHEIIHVSDRHIVKAVQKGSRYESFANVAGLYSDQKGKDTAKLVGNFTAEFFSRGYDKEEEFAADRKGVVIAARAGYDPYGLAGVLQTLASINPESDAVSLMFKTHPDSGQRLELLTTAMEGRLDQYADHPKLADRFTRVVQAHVARYTPAKKN